MAGTAFGQAQQSLDAAMMNLAKDAPKEASETYLLEV
jgi:hypothetical protein